MDKPPSFDPRRRSFLKKSSLGASFLALHPLATPPQDASADLQIRSRAFRSPAQPSLTPLPERELDLAPAQWIWYPSGRTLQNTVVLFRRALPLTEKPLRATGWILGDSRYKLYVNGTYQQWGPAPSDPRWAEADPIDLTEALHVGDNVIGAQVLYFGMGDGTWPIGKAGFIFHLTLTYADGRTETIVSDESWHTHLARSWQPGHYKRWYLRAFQEAFDARLYPFGWTTAAFAIHADWLPAQDQGGWSNKPALCTRQRDYLFESNGDPETCQLRARTVPMLREVDVLGATLTESLSLLWKRPVVEYFESLTPNAFDVDRTPVATSASDGTWRVRMQPNRGAVVTFSFDEHVVGWPYFTIEAPAGTIIELMVHEGHEVGGPALLNTRFHSWTRFTCKEGQNTFETFDFESLRWLQLHIHGTTRDVTVSHVGIRRRLYPWPQDTNIACADPALQRLWDASINTLNNCAHDTIVDCMGRERQQYSGDIGHTLHAIFYAFGDTRLPARFADTFSQGLTYAGYFMDCWPAYDRLARIPERELQLTPWGPLLDHGIGFNFDCYHYYLYSGDINTLAEVYPRLLRFLGYLQTLPDTNGLLPVENLGVPTVWIDHDAYQRQRHKQCAFNLYAAGMLTHALPALCRAHGDEEEATVAEAFGASLLDATIAHFWDASQGLFVVNRPWLDEEAGPRYCDRSLSHALLYNQFPDDNTAAAVQMLADAPPTMGFSYPANAGWRLWGLATGKRVDVVIDELRNRWAPMRSVLENNTLSEGWNPRYDTRDQWSHAPVAPLYLLYMAIAGIQPTTPGFSTYAIQPHFSDLPTLSFVAHTVRGPIPIAIEGTLGNRTLTLRALPDSEGTLWLDHRETIDLPLVSQDADANRRAYRLPAGKEIHLRLRYT